MNMQIHYVKHTRTTRDGKVQIGYVKIDEGQRFLPVMTRAQCEAKAARYGCAAVFLPGAPATR